MQPRILSSQEWSRRLGDERLASLDLVLVESPQADAAAVARQRSATHSWTVLTHILRLME